MKESILVEQKLDSIIEDYMYEQGIPGMAIGIIKDGKILLQKGYGYRNIETREPITDESLFHMASVSKTFVATAIVQLHEEGKIDIFRPVVDYIPYFKSKDERYKQITIQHMLSHTSGITYVDDALWGKGPHDDGALEYYVRSLSELELMWDPANKFYYNNTVYEVLGHLIAKVSGMTFEDYIKKNILEPLEMKESTFLKKEVNKTLATSPHIMTSNSEENIVVSNIYPYNRMHAPSSTLHSSVQEMCNFGMAYLKKGKFKNNRIYTEESYDLMFTPQVDFIHNNLETQMGLTWFMNDYKGFRVFSHSGSDTGFNSKIAFIPDVNSFVVYTCNCDFSNVEAITNTLLDIVLDDKLSPLKISANKAFIEAINNEGIKGAYRLFDSLKKGFDNKYLIRERDLNNLSYMYMSENKLEKAIDVLKMGLDEYPNSSSFYNMLGQCYMKKEDEQLAIKFFKKAYEINPGDFIAKKAIEN